MIWIDLKCFETGYILIPEIYSFTENVYTQIYIFVYHICIWWIHVRNYFRVFINTTYIGNYNVVINQYKYTSVTISYIHDDDDDDDNDYHDQR